ncbi:UvrD-helicase domain-containing protein [Virgibacillus sp. DJP39]|uniref:UvrD-helicase domain-containing protein n=1 Tax=Virgibacillus sp. DJP39 TaxID=3409790 RepID=UPI003BB50543
MSKETNAHDKFYELHGDDESQLNAIYSTANKIMVEAPAGYGKTKTLISKIAYDIIQKNVINHKKILVITFSINAAHKIKRDITSELPILLQDQLEPDTKIATKKLLVTNYHGFCRRVLGKYGYLIHKNLKNIDQIQIINLRVDSTLTTKEKEVIHALENSIRNLNSKGIEQYKDSYLDILVSNLLPNNFITHDGIILLTEMLFKKFPNVLKFYQKIFSSIIIDEFQDTNLLNWGLMKLLINENMKAQFFGDSLQKIYGFIGAIPYLLDEAAEYYNMEYHHLQKNYRFMDNEEMLLLDKNVRAVAKNPQSPDIISQSIVNLNLYESQTEEAQGIVDLIQALPLHGTKEKISILFRQRGKNLDKVLEVLDENNITYFNGLYLQDEDPTYIEFHNKCLNKFIEFIGGKNSITKKSLREFYSIFSLEVTKQTIKTKALLTLLEIFVDNVSKETIWKHFSFEERRSFILNFFSGKGLKNYIEYVNEKVIISTVFGAKGLEWDYVIIPDLEKDSMPNYMGMCKECLYKKNCELQIHEENESDFIDELGVFYVALTRAKVQTYFTASKKNGYGYPTNITCFLKLPGIKINYTSNKTMMS